MSSKLGLEWPKSQNGRKTPKVSDFLKTGMIKKSQNDKKIPEVPDFFQNHSNMDSTIWPKFVKTSHKSAKMAV